MAGRKRTKSDAEYYRGAFERTAAKLGKEIIAHEDTIENAKQTRFALLLELSEKEKFNDMLNEQLLEALRENRALKNEETE